MTWELLDHPRSRMYCDEHGTDHIYMACPYHNRYECPGCGEQEVQLVHVSANPEDGDQWECQNCGKVEPA